LAKIYNRHHHNEPEGSVYVGRPTKWGNPFSFQSNTTAPHNVASREEAVAAFRNWIMLDRPYQNGLRAQAKVELKGKDLVCWCSPASCHAEVWMEIANG